MDTLKHQSHGRTQITFTCMTVLFSPDTCTHEVMTYCSHCTLPITDLGMSGDSWSRGKTSIYLSYHNIGTHVTNRLKELFLAENESNAA